MKEVNPMKKIVLTGGGTLGHVTPHLALIPRLQEKGYEIHYIGTEKKTVTGRKGYVVETWKIWYQGNRETRRELLFKTTYKAYQETIEYNPR